jgi:hypothetical protein
LTADGGKNAAAFNDVPGLDAKQQVLEIREAMEDRFTHRRNVRASRTASSDARS